MRRLAALAVGTILVASCEQQPDAAPVPPPPEEGETAPAEGGAVTIGLLYTVTGEGGEFAGAALGAAGLAVEDAADEGVQVELIEADYGGQAGQAPQMAEDLVDQGAAGIVVASGDPGLGPALEDFDEVPVIHTLVTDDDAVDGASLFRVGSSNRLQAQKLAEYLVGDRGYDRIAIMHDDDESSTEGAADTEEAVEDEGASAVLNQGFKVGGDIHTPVMHAGQLDADALVLWTRDNGEAGRITIEIQKADQGYQLALSGNLATFSYGQNAASQVTPVAFRDGILSVGTWAGPWFELERMRGFYERLQESISADPPVQAAQVYDGVLLLSQVAAEVPPGGDLSEALEEVEGFQGAGVPVSFSAESHEGVGMEDMAILAFTTNQASAGGDLAPDVSTGGGFFTINSRTVELPPDQAYLLEGLAS